MHGADSKWVRSRNSHLSISNVKTTTILIKYLCLSRDYMWDPITETTISCVQIIEVRVQCVVVDMHVNQSLQKRKKLKSNVLVLWKYGYKKHNVRNQRVSVGVTTLLFQSYLLEGHWSQCHMPFYVYPLTKTFQKIKWLQGLISTFLSSYLGPNFVKPCILVPKERNIYRNETNSFLLPRQSGFLAFQAFVSWISLIVMYCFPKDDSLDIIALIIPQKTNQWGHYSFAVFQVRRTLVGVLNYKSNFKNRGLILRGLE